MSLVLYPPGRRLYVSMYVCMNKSTYTMLTRIDLCSRIVMISLVCIHVCMCVCMYKYTYTLHTQIELFFRIAMSLVCMCVYVCMYPCVYVSMCGCIEYMYKYLLHTYCTHGIVTYTYCTHGIVLCAQISLKLY